MLSIGKVAAMAGVSVQTLRNYEALGLLGATKRTLSGRRVYAPDDVGRILFVRRARGMGFGLDQIADLIRLQANHPIVCDRADTFASQNLEGIRQQIAELQAIESRLTGLLSACREKQDGRCRLVAAASSN